MLLGAGPRGQVTAENMPSLSRGLLGDDRKSYVEMENLIVKLFDCDSFEDRFWILHIMYH